MTFYIGYNVVYTLSSYFSGGLADRFPKNRVLAAGYSIAVIPAAALLWPGDSFIKFGIVFAFSGLYMGVWETLESSTAATLLPQTARAPDSASWPPCRASATSFPASSWDSCGFCTRHGRWDS